MAGDYALAGDHVDADRPRRHKGFRDGDEQSVAPPSDLLKPYENDILLHASILALELY
jgi:hypothetical protein